MIVKVCGMAKAGNIEKIASLEPDMMGFIFYPLSPRNAFGLLPENLEKISDKIHKVGVFVNESRDDILRVSLQYGLTVVQLHGNESPELCRMFRSMGYKVIKAIAAGAEEDFYKACSYDDCVDFLLFDTKSKKYGGTGSSFDWELLRYYEGRVPFLLSGGIGLSDAQRVLEIEHPRFGGVDLNSRFEKEPGVKDEDMLRQFIQIIRNK